LLKVMAEVRCTFVFKAKNIRIQTWGRLMNAFGSTKYRSFSCIAML
jgi:hypothetical protein